MASKREMIYRMASQKNRISAIIMMAAIIMFFIGCGHKPPKRSKLDQYIVKADIMASRGNCQDAVKLYRKALKHQVSNSGLYMKMASCFEKLAMPDSAITYYEGAIVYDPQNVDAYQAIGDIYYNRRMYHEAMTWYDRGLELGHISPQSYCRLATIYYQWREYERAEQYFNDAVSIDSTFAEAYYGLGLLSYSDGDTVLARIYWLKAVDIGPHAEAAFMLGKLDFDRNQFWEAEKWFDTYMELEPAGRWDSRAREFKRIIAIRKRSGEK